MPSLTRHRIVMESAGNTPGDAGMVFAPRWMEEPVEVYFMPLQDWVDMGQPKQITVTIEPGNTLSGMESADA